MLHETFTMGRHTGVTLEARAILADFDPSERRLTVYHSFQAPNMMQDILARHLNLPEHDVRVICKDVGGASESRCTSTQTRWRPARSA